MKYLLIILGIVILVTVLIDIFKTILYINGGGRLLGYIKKDGWDWEDMVKAK